MPKIIGGATLVDFEALKAFAGFTTNAGGSWMSAQQGAGVSGGAWIGQDFAILDANPKDVLAELLTNIHFGAGFPSARIGDWSAYAAYCAAAGLFVSPAYVEQQSMADIGAQLMKISNAEPFYSEGLLKITPRGDAALSGNGASYTPDLTVRYQLDDDAFEYADGEDPVTVERVSNADACNMVTVKFYNRANGYALETAEAKDEAHIATYGLRPLDPVEIREVADPAVARMVAQMLLQRELNVRNRYTFRLGWRFSRLEPMDIVGLTDAALGCSQYPVRIVQIDDADDVLTVISEELALGAGAAASYGSQAGASAIRDSNVNPGSVNVPVILDAPAVATDSGFEIWLAISGANPNWGGCQVWTATDPAGPYTLAGTVFGAARHGVLAGSFAAGADPDTVNSCAVDLGLSKGELTGGTQADADNLSTLSWIEGELISFQAATLTGANAYTLGTYLRRGVFNTPIAAHAGAERFVRLDQAVFRYPYDPNLAGKLIHLKLPSFNIFGAGQQGLADVVPTAYLIRGPIGAPDAPAGFAVQQAGNVLNFKVDPVATLRLDRVEVRYADPGETMWENGIAVTNILRGNTDSNGSVPPGTWRFMARAYDPAGNPSKTWAVYDLTVTADDFQAIKFRQDAPDWPSRDHAVSFDGTGAQLQSASLASLKTESFSWEFTFIPRDLPAVKFLLQKNIETGTGPRLFQDGSAGTIQLDGQPGELGNLTSAGWVNGVPQHCVATYDQPSGTMKIYRDGVLVASNTGVSTLNGTVDGILRVSSTASLQVNATFDEVRSYNRALTAAEVALLYGGKDPADLVGSALVLRWAMDEGSGTSIADRSGNGNTGTISGSGYGWVESTASSHFVVTWSGALIPCGRLRGSSYAGNEWIDNWVPDPYAICTYEMPEIDKGIDASARIWGDIVSVLGPGISVGTASPKNQIDYRLSTGSYAGFQDWSIGTVAFRYLKSRLVLDTAAGLAKITGFSTTADRVPVTEEKHGIAIGASGQAVTFDTSYHATPAITALSDDATPKIGTHTADGVTGTTLHLYNTSGTEVGGAGGYRTRGV